MASQRLPQHGLSLASPLGEGYRHLQWGTAGQGLLPGASKSPYPPADHSLGLHSVPVAPLGLPQSGFRKLKSNQIEVLQELRREYEVLRNADLDATVYQNNRLDTESQDSQSESVSKSLKSDSEPRSSSHSRGERTRRKSQAREGRLLSLEQRQLQLMLNNSMKKIEQLLAEEIRLKKKVAELEAQLELHHHTQQEQQLADRRANQQLEASRRNLEEAHREVEAHRNANKELTAALGSLEGQLAVAQLQLRKREEQTRALEEEVALQRNRFCNLELDLKKEQLEAQLCQRTHQEEVLLLQKRLQASEAQLLTQQEEQVRTFNRQIELKEERYQLLAQQNQQHQTQIAHLEDKLQASQDCLRTLEGQLQAGKAERDQRATASEQTVGALLQQVAEANSRPNEGLLEEIAGLKREVETLCSQQPSPSDSQLQERIRQLEQSIEEENLEKLYFIEDLKRIKQQLMEERRGREQTLAEATQLRQALSQAQEQAIRTTLQLQTLRQQAEADLASRAKARSQQEELGEDLSRVVEGHRSRINQYEDELKVLRRQLAEEEVRSFKIKEESELRLAIAKAELETEVSRLQEEIGRLKKEQAMQLNEHSSLKVLLEQKLMEKSQETDKASQQLSQYLKERDLLFKEFRVEQDKRVRTLQEEHGARMSRLAEKLEGLAEARAQQSQLLHRNALLEREVGELRQVLREHRVSSEGLDHLWAVKEAEYANVAAILAVLD